MYSGPSPATTGVLKLAPSDAARSGNMLRIAQAALDLMAHLQEKQRRTDIRRHCFAILLIFNHRRLLDDRWLNRRGVSRGGRSRGGLSHLLVGRMAEVD